MNEFEKIINRPTPVLVDFFAEWCGPCKVMSPILKEVKDKMGDDVSIIKVDVDRNSALAKQFQIMGVPTLILFKGGIQKWRESGVIRSEDLIRVLERYK